MRRMISNIAAVLLLSMLCVLPLAGQGIITTVAGGGPNNMAATSANLANPFAVAFDGSGNLYIAADTLHRVFKVSTTGQLTVVAGVGVPGFSGDGGPATAANLNRPLGLAVDAAGNIYVMEFNNRRVRRVDAATGIITTFAGNGLFGFGGDGGPATNAQFDSPIGLALDAAGNLFIADQGNSRIRRVNAATGIITTVAGNGSSFFSGDGGPATSASLRFPSGVAIDAAGNLFIADRSNSRIRRVNALTGIIATVAGNGAFGFSGDGGPATSASLNSPLTVAVDSAGNLFIADTPNQRVRRVDAGTGVITTVVGNGVGSFSGDGGPAASASLSGPVGLAFDATGNLFVAAQGNARVRSVAGGVDGLITGAADEIIATVAGNGSPFFSGDGGPAIDAGKSFPSGVGAAGDMSIYVSTDQRIRKIDSAGNISTVAGDGLAGFSGDGGPATSARVSSPMGVAAAPDGSIYFVDRFNARIRKIDPAGIITTVAGNGAFGFSGDGGPATSARLASPWDVAVSADGSLYIADLSNSRIRKVDPAGIITTVAGNGSFSFCGDGGPATSACLAGPRGVAVAADGSVYIADTGNQRIRKVNSAGIITIVAGNGLGGFSGDGGTATSARLNNPVSVAVAPDGSLFIGDQFNNRIRRVDPTGVITTAAGDGTFGFAGDGGLAINARLANPSNVALAADGSLFIADSNNNRIRRVEGAVPTDSTAPVIMPTVTGTLGNGGWYVSNVSVSWAVSDAESAITASSGCDATTLTADTAGMTFTCSATSGGGTASQSVTIKRDATAPDIQFAGRTAANGAGWNNADVTVDWTCSDALSGANSLNVSETQTAEGANQSATGTCEDAAGNSSSDTQTGINTDKTAPTVNITAPANGATYLLNAMVAADYACADTLSGIGACAGPVASGANVATGSVGAHSFTVNATDAAGNTASATHNYSVQYSFGGFLQPVDNLPVINQAKPGRTIPVKWQLKDAAGNYVSDLGSYVSLLSAPMACDAAPSAIIEEQLISPGATVFRYDATSNQFIFNWKSSSGWRGCRLLQLTLSDGTVHYAKFNFK